MGHRKMLIAAVIATASGLAFGASAMLLMLNPKFTGAIFGLGWLIVHIVSGTWSWAVLTTLLSWLLVRRSELEGWRRYVWAALLALLFLIATTIAWYGVASDSSILGLMPKIIVVNLPVVTGIGFVAAFSDLRSWLGLVARLCLPVGLAVVVFVGSPPDYLALASGESAVMLAVWWSQMAISAVLALYFLIRWFLVDSKIKPQGD